MKKVFLVFLVLLLSACVLSFSGCGKAKANPDCIRIHIRANSNLEDDQQVKMQVVEQVVNYLTPLLADCGGTADARVVIQQNLDNVAEVANQTLKGLSKSYNAQAKLTTEAFPTRQYADYVIPSGEYEALIIELGEGEGNNWWCVAFPPLCFVPVDNGENFRYKSKIVEIIQKYFGGEDDKNS